MHLWTLNAAEPGPPPMGQAPMTHALTGVVRSVGRSNFGAAALDSLNDALAIDSWSIYRVYPEQPPCLHASGSYRVPDTTRDCFRAYERGLYRADASFDGARAADRTAVMTHLHADELPAAHRDQIYLQYGMRERLSIISAGAADDGLMAINLYRHAHQRPFVRDDFDLVQGAAPFLLACVERHVELCASPGGHGAETVALPPALDALGRLKQCCPGLTGRELQICERLLRGWTHDGIACDLKLSVATVKTYRNRAFARLGIHFRNELFGLVLQSRTAH